MTPEHNDRRELTWEAVLDINRRLGLPHVVRFFAGHTEAERRAFVPFLKTELTRSGDREWSGWDPWVDNRALFKVSGAACVGGPSALAQWLSRASLRTNGAPLVNERIREALALRPAEWIPDLTRRLADRPSDTSGTDEWELVDRLSRDHGLEPPTGAAYVTGWFNRHTPGSRQDSGLVQALHADPYTRALLPLLFEVEQIGRLIDNHDRWHPEPAEQWVHALADLAGSALIGRDTIVDACLSRLLRGAPVADIRGFVRLYGALELTDDEIAARAPTFLRLLPDAYSTVAALAQAALRRLDESGRLTADQVAEATRAVLFRPEKKLVRAQFTWLDKAVARHRDRAGELLSATTTVFTQSASDLHDRALKSLGRHLPKLTDDQATLVRAELRATVDLIDGPARVEAAVLLGEDPVSAAVDMPGPPPFTPRELPPEIGTLDELVEELVALMSDARNQMWSSQAAPTDPWAVERVLTAVLREKDRDREALAAAVAPLEDRFVAFGHLEPGSALPDNVPGGLYGILRAVGGRGGPTGWFRGLFGKGETAPEFPATMLGPQRMLIARLDEVAQRIRATHSGPYLARPVTAAGHVDPAELVRGLEEWEASGHTPWACDLEQALLRLPRDLDPDTTARAGKLSSPAGMWAWEVMLHGGMAHPDVTPGRGRRPLGIWERRHPGVDTEEFRVVDVGTVPGPFAQGRLARYMCDADNVAREWDNQFRYVSHRDIRCWPSLMPEHRDVVAAHVVPALMVAVGERRAGCEVLSLLAESEGPTGDGVATAFAYGLVAKTAEDRVAAVDGFLTLASRDDGTWDASAVGTALADLVSIGQAKTNRLHDSLRQAVDAGAHAATWRVMSGLLPVLLTGTAKVPRLGDLLGLAAECASPAGARGEIAGLEAYAAAKGSSRVAVEARRLRTVLSAT